MAVPKKRTTRSKRNMRRSHHAASLRALSSCSKCSSRVPSHTACPTCGTYAGREVINVMRNIERQNKRDKASQS